MTETF